MNVIAKRKLPKAGEKLGLAAEMDEWYRAAKLAKWRSLADVRVGFASADKIGNVLVFNVRGNQFRLITRVNFHAQAIYFKSLMTEKQYEREEWKKWI